VVSGDHAHCWTSDIAKKKWRERKLSLLPMQGIGQTMSYVCSLATCTQHCAVTRVIERQFRLATSCSTFKLEPVISEMSCNLEIQYSHVIEI